MNRIREGTWSEITKHCGDTFRHLSSGQEISIDGIAPEGVELTFGRPSWALPEDRFRFVRSLLGGREIPDV